MNEDPEHLEFELSKAAPHLKVAANELAAEGFGDAAAVVGTLATIGDGADLHHVAAMLWLGIQKMEPDERVFAFGLIYDTAAAMIAAGDPEEEEAAFELGRWLESVAKVYPDEVARAVTMP